MTAACPNIVTSVIFEAGQLLGDTTDSTHGTVVNLSCPEGYTLDGDARLTCTNGAWNPAVPDCIIAPIEVPEEGMSDEEKIAIIVSACVAAAVIIFLIVIWYCYVRRRKDVYGKYVGDTYPMVSSYGDGAYDRSYPNKRQPSVYTEDDRSGYGYRREEHSPWYKTYPPPVSVIDVDPPSYNDYRPTSGHTSSSRHYNDVTYDRKRDRRELERVHRPYPSYSSHMDNESYHSYRDVGTMLGSHSSRHWQSRGPPSRGSYY